MIKLLLSWDVREGKESEYFEFAVKEFLPAIQKLGLQPAEAWYTIYGDAPQILTAMVAEDIDSVRRALRTGEWRAIKDKLLTYVVNYSERAVPAGTRFQM